tara:strand:+ start:1553 stop:2290 length:738 start_codon:yes stop_codon:yes gene_type:complete
MRVQQTMYLNNQSINNNKYFETSKDLLKYSDKKLNQIKAYKKRTGFLKNSNSKLGRKIYAFDLPAVVSCPDSSECFKDCYANKGSFIWKSAKQSNTFNFAIALNDIEYLQKELIKEIEKKNIKFIRIHSSGDFFSKEYFLMWCNIAKHFEDLKIFTYSKAPQIDRKLIPSNLNIINSFIEIDGNRYLNFGSYEAMKKLAKKSRGLLCPITKGTYLDKPKLTPKENFTCSTCKYCITKSKPTFIQH